MSTEHADDSPRLKNTTLSEKLSLNFSIFTALNQLMIFYFHLSNFSIASGDDAMIILY